MGRNFTINTRLFNLIGGLLRLTAGEPEVSFLPFANLQTISL